MKTFLTANLTACVVAGLLAGGCISSKNNQPDASSAFMPVANMGPPVTDVYGYAMDHEAFWFQFATCAGPTGANCPIPPIVVPGVPVFTRSLIPGAQALLFDGENPMAMPKPAAQLTGADGTWAIPANPRRPGQPYFAIAAVPPPTGTPMDPGYVTPFTAPNGAVILPAVPRTNYFPTFNLKPIAPNWSMCMGQEAGIIGDNGILEAVAKRIGGITAADFLDPAKYGGVAIWWLWMPTSPIARVPAFGAKATADVGTTYFISWAPPGLGGATQSARGYLAVADPVAGNGIGISVTVLPPNTAAPMAPTFVHFTTEDPVTDTTALRPWSWPPLPPQVPIAPGVISFGTLPAITNGGLRVPDWVCLPQ